MKAVSPTGAEIEGTLERLSGVAYAGVTRKPDGTLDIDYQGETKIWWDEQITVEEDGKILFVDRNGDQWKEDELVFVEEDDRHPDDPEDYGDGYGG